MNGYVWYSPLKDFRASNRKLSCVGFEATIIKLCLDALTNWAIRPDFQIAVRTNFAQLLQIFIFCSVFIFYCVHCLGHFLRLFKWKFWTSVHTFQPIELLLHEFTSYSDSNLYSCYFSFFFCSVFRYHFSLLPLLYVTFALIEFFKGNHMSLAEWSETYAIHDWMIIRKSSRNSAWVKFELTITEFCS